MRKVHQAKHIPDKVVLDYLAQRPTVWHTWWRIEPKEPNDMPTVADAVPPEIPERVILAKMRALVSRKLVIGCACGCRGDFHLVDA